MRNDLVISNKSTRLEPSSSNHHGCICVEEEVEGFEDKIVYKLSKVNQPASIFINEIEHRGLDAYKLFYLFFSVLFILFLKLQTKIKGKIENLLIRI